MTIAVRAEPLERFCERVVVAMGAEPPVAAEVARHLVLANLSGHDSHGVQRLAMYVRWADDGILVPGAGPEVVRESPVSVLVDGHDTFGHYSTLFTLERCMERAAHSGLAVGVLRNPTHTGRMGTYSEVAVGRGFVCLATTGSTRPGKGLVVPFGSVEGTLGTNPWTIGVPAAGGHAPFVYDAATSAIAEGKVRLAQFRGVRTPEGALLDGSGAPTTDPDRLYDGGALMPVGGARFGHKGSAFSVAAALLGALAAPDEGDPGPDGGIGGVFVLVLSPSLFGAPDAHGTLVARALDQVKAAAPAPGVAEVLHAGEPERRSRAERGARGIPLPDTVWAELTSVSERFGVDLPSPG